MYSDLVSSIQSQASQCVKCGLCLPYCPTYGLTQNENESPRGRIALMQNLATEALTLSVKAHDHIDNCLSCKECERVCPAQVPYESLLLDYRAWEKPKLAAIHVKTPFITQMFKRLVLSPSKLQHLTKILWFSQKLGLRFMAEQSGLIKLLGLTRLNALLPKSLSYPKPLMPHYPAIGPRVGKVALFRGCLSTVFDAQTNRDAITVLQHLGYDVIVPKSQTCCGAIASHGGDAIEAKALLDKNIASFSEQALTDIHQIITTASGCASQLLNTGFFRGKIIDICDFVYSHPWPEAVKTKLIHTLPQFTHEKIAVHTPCTLRNSLKKPMVSQNFLERLGLNCQKLQTAEQCCGSAGTHMLSHVEASETLLDSALIDLDQIAPTRLVTSNIGCALHFQKRFTEQNKPIRVCHPVSLFAEMLVNS
jgi:glycolate oxidase iron-sulfur subunit